MKVPLSAHWELLRRYVAPHSGTVALMAVSLLMHIALQALAPQIVRAFIDAAHTGAAEHVLVGWAITFVGLAFLQHVASVCAVFWGARVAWRATNALRADLIAHLLSLDLDYFKQRTPGELIERVDGDVSALTDFFSSFAVQLLGSVLLLGTVLVIVFKINVWMGLGMVAFVLVAVVLLIWVRRFATPHWKEDREESTAFYGYLGEVLSATEDIRTSGAVPYAIRRFLGHLSRWMPVRKRAEVRRSVVWMTAVAIFALGDVAAHSLGGGLYFRGSLSLGTVYMLVAYMGVLADPIDKIRTQLQGLQRADASIGRIRQLVSIKPKLRDGSSELPPGPLSAEFTAVRFGYDLTAESSAKRGEDSFVLWNLSFRVEPGKVLGLLGRTGSGKSTIARLLCRLYDPQNGAVCLGGTDLRDARMDSVRQRVALVTQDVQILNATLRENITLFDPAITDAQILQAFEVMGLTGWLKEQAQGLDAPVSSSTLSAGEAQLVALTRVFMRDPGLVVLDEASSRLDPATETLLEKALDKLLEGRTAVVIAHRLATIDRADDILILQEQGGVLEYGSRRELANDPSSAFAALKQIGVGELLGR